MRKLILIAAISLLATEAYAGGSRSLSLAAGSANQQVEQPATAAAAPVPPQATQAPAAPQATNVQTATTTPTSTAPAATAAPAPATAAAPASPTAAPVTTSATETTKAKRRQPSTEARVIRELHRHGIYW
ncbi:hypothetical protein [Bradyrhizobium stylosanthis]|uniref:Uncharacterized protein n=1 Tax=Bradyrhizobium stylosanthis TaxID=1803665 RepID=A0A560EBN5_9BRAD|nr:hypothetical protein [Bradyrhizobium stylosanthis]TWB06761.1 hypothetical protein FBZ96_101576 [Bradyrhizobium stylosanthis]